MSTPTIPKEDAREVRPKVYLDHEGGEWRCVGDELQARIIDEDHEDYNHDTGEGPMETKFRTGDFGSNAAWLAFLEKSFPRVLPVACAAMANPMTADEALEDDGNFS